MNMQSYGPQRVSATGIKPGWWGELGEAVGGFAST